MPALTLTKTEGLSIGALPLPAGWTTDVSSHVVPCCVRPTAANAAQGSSSASFYEGSMNVLRCESRDRRGDTLYVTEYYRPRLYDQSSRSAAHVLGDEDMQKALQSMPPCRPERPPLFARTVEITDDLVPLLPPSRQPRLPFSALLQSGSPAPAMTAAPVDFGAGSSNTQPSTTSEATATEHEDGIIHTPIDCIAARLLPSFHIFLQVVLDAADGASREMEKMAETILQDAIKRYVQPLMELPHLRAVVDPRISLEQPDSGANLARHLDYAATEEELTTLTLRQACSPLTLTERGMPSMGVFAKSARTVMSFRRLYTTRLTASVRLSDGKQRDCSERVAVSLFHTHWNAGRQHNRSLDGVVTTPTEALRQMVKHGLKLPSEDLVVEIPLRMLECERTTEAMLHPIALATLPVAQHPLFSLYNYRSVEAILAAHVAARPIVKEAGWTLSPIPWLKDTCRFVPSAAFVAAVESQSADTVVGDHDAAASRARRDVVKSAWGRDASGGGRVPPRCTFYLLEPPQTPQAHEGDARQGEHAAMGYVIGLVAPRVQSGEALLAITPLRPHESLTRPTLTPQSCQGVAFASREDVVRATCRFMIDGMMVTSPVTSEWGPLCKPTAETVPGALFQQGELVLEVPAGDARYRNAVVVPTAAFYFTTRGSLTLYTQPSVSFTESSVPVASGEKSGASSTARKGDEAVLSAETSQILSPSVTAPGAQLNSLDGVRRPFACLCAVWTVVADGRSSAEYIDYTISEFQYDLDVKNLGNVGARSHLNDPDTLVVRRRKQEPRRSLKSSIATTTAARSAGVNHTQVTTTATGGKSVGETWSVWLDMGTAKRLFVLVSECGLGQLVVVQATLPAARAMNKQPQPQASAPSHTPTAPCTDEVLTPEQEERMLEEWVRDVPIAVLPRL